jgi:alpha-galactosidase
MPFSFTYDGRPSPELLVRWTVHRASRALDAQRTEHTLAWTDPETGLAVRCVAVEYRDFPTIEWTLYFRNTGATATPVLEGIQALDLHLQRGQDGEFLLHHAVGSPCSAADYEPLKTVLGPGARQRITAAGGRPTNTDMTYFDLELPGVGGLIIALGWPGQWASEWVRDGGRGLRVVAGQELVHLKLLPGEEIRSPLIVLQFWRGGDWLRAQNIWRRWFIAHSLRRPGGKLPPTQWCGASEVGDSMMIAATEASQRRYVDAYLARGLRPDFWWMDAGWYPCGGDWTCTGTWEPDPARFPHGLRPVTDYLHARGIRANLWFEPERVRRGTWLATEHPDWVLWPDDGGDGLLDLGNPAAWRWLVDHLDRFLTEAGLDIYRQDFNMGPLPYWRAHDAEDRQGITEMRHVTGLLAYWDELLRRHPAVLYDNCASGGTRNDLESMRRGVPYTKSDYAHDPVGVQGETYGISLWLPYFAATWDSSDDAYLCRSRLAHVVGRCLDLRVEADPRELLHRLAEWRGVARCYWGDFWPLTPYSLDSGAWIAWQFDLPEAGEGVVQAFRRADCPADSIRVKLRGLDPRATYRLRDVDAAEADELSGAALMEDDLSVSIPKAPGAAIVAYRRL